MPVPTKYIWMNGELLPWERAAVHVMTYALHMGSSIFEGIRCYDTARGPALFRCGDHLRRLNDSARIYGMELPFGPDALLQACRDVVRENELESAYVRPLCWLGLGEMGTNPTDKPVETMVAAIRWGTYLGRDGLEHGVDVGVSSWRRLAPGTIPTMAKAGGAYLSSQLISREARRHGYAEGIALDASGYLSEGSAENIFVIRNGIVFTPPITAAILPGITRDSVITLANGMGIEVREQQLPREVLYVADEIFFTGTAAELTPVRSVDGVQVGKGGRGPITTRLQKAFFGLFSGETADRWGWLEPVDAAGDDDEAAHDQADGATRAARR